MFAIKVEPYDSDAPQLEHEYYIYCKLRGCIAVPRVHWFGAECEHNVMAMDLLGPSLEDLRMQSGGRLSLPQVRLLADQLVRRISAIQRRAKLFICAQISRLQSLHDCNIIHRDLKPANLLLNCESSYSSLYIIDFGLAVPYLDEHTGHHVPAYALGKSLVGTARYASLNSHKGLRLSRRDDIESAAYVLLLLAAGRLPWPETFGTSKKDIAAVYRLKQACDLDLFCQEVQVPLEFAHAARYARQLGYAEQPDYRRLRGLYRGIGEDAEGKGGCSPGGPAALSHQDEPGMCPLAGKLSKKTTW